MERLPYNFSYINYSTTQSIPREKDCNGFTATNVGDTIATINGVPLFPSATPATAIGDSVSFGGNAGEVFVGRIDLAFVQPIVTNPNVLIIQKFYVKDYTKENS